MQIDTYVRDISILRITHAEEAGVRGANMGEMVAAKLPVPPRFAVLAAASTPMKEKQRDLGGGGIRPRQHKAESSPELMDLPASEFAVDWAAHDALLRGVPLTVVHVLPTKDATMAVSVSSGVPVIVAGSS
jgi:hypothetical protein